MYKFGLVSVSFRSLEPRRIIEISGEAGLDCIEWGSDIHAPCGETEKIENIRKMCASAGIVCCSYGTYFKIGKHTPDMLLPYIKAAKILGTSILRIWCGTKGSDKYTRGEKDALFAECCKCAAIAAENGVTLCCECHNGTFTDTVNGALELMETVNSPSFQMYWQPNQYLSSEDNLVYAEKIAPFTKVIHVFNWQGDKKFCLADGAEIWKKYLALFPDDMTLLLEFMPDGKPESLKTEFAALYKIGTEI